MFTARQVEAWTRWATRLVARDVSNVSPAKLNAFGAPRVSGRGDRGGAELSGVANVGRGANCRLRLPDVATNEPDINHPARAGHHSLTHSRLAGQKCDISA